jgi:hypothetical protein
MGKRNLFFWDPTLQPLGNFSHVATYRNFSKNTRKLNIHPTLNKNSPWAHIESKFDMLGVARKLVKYVVCSSKIK